VDLTEDIDLAKLEEKGVKGRYVSAERIKVTSYTYSANRQLNPSRSFQVVRSSGEWRRPARPEAAFRTFVSLPILISAKLF
jgi:hypothetical protein